MVKTLRGREGIGCILLYSAVMIGQAQHAGEVVPGMRASIPMCKASDLSLGTDSEHGNFNGMSHAGTLLVLRNVSSAACRVPARPEIGFVDGAKMSGLAPHGVPLPIKLNVPGARYMHPGPVILPVVIAPDAEATSKLRWVSGEVYDHNLCFNPTTITVTLQGEEQRASLSAHICGDKSNGVTFEATPLAPDPQFKP